MKISGESICILRTSEFSPDPRVDRLAGFLVGQGANVRLLGINRSGRSKPRESSGYIQIERFTIPCGSRLPVGNLLFAPFLGLWIVWSFFRLNRLRPSTVIACDFDAMIPSLFYAMVAGASFIYNPHDFYADNFKKPIPDFVGSLIRELERRLVHHAKGLILPDITRLKQFSNSKLPCHIVEIVNTPIDIVEDTIDLSEYHVSDGQVVVFYGGQLSRHRGLVKLVDAIHELNGVHFIVAGHGEHEDFITKYIANHSNCTFIGRVSHRDVMRLTKACDVVVALYDPAIPNHLFASPNKLFESMCYGKPIVVNDGTRLSDLVSLHKCGLVVPYGDHRAIMDAMRKLRDDKDLRILLGANGRKAFEAQYRWSAMEKRLVPFFDSL